MIARHGCASRGALGIGGGAKPSSWPTRSLAGGPSRTVWSGSSRLSRLDDSGEFWLDDLPSGIYRLEVAFQDRAIEVPVLSI